MEENKLEQLSQKLELVDCEIEEIKKLNVEEEFEIKEAYERKQSQIESRIRKLRQENSKYDQENAETAQELKESENLEHQLQQKIQQLKVENQWLISEQKTFSVKEKRVEQMR